MLIDQFLPRFDICARYHRVIQAPIERVYTVTRHLDVRSSRAVNWLYRLRGLPESGLTLDGMMKLGFVLLADKPSQEIVFGLIGRFWTLSAHIQRVSPRAFVKFDRPGFAKVAGNMAFTPVGNGKVRVSTETRVRCLDDKSRRYFRLYWSLIAPFSGIVRKEWLRLIKKQAETPYV